MSQGALALSDDAPRGQFCGHSGPEACGTRTAAVGGSKALTSPAEQKQVSPCVTKASPKSSHGDPLVTQIALWGPGSQRRE